VSNLTTDGTFPGTFAILLASTAIGGAERYLVELAIAMRQSETRPVILNLKSTIPYSADLLGHGVDLQLGIAPSRWDPTAVFKLVRALGKARPDVLLINSNRQALIVGGLASRLSRVPVTLVHTHDHIGPNYPAMRVLAATTDGIVAAAAQHRAFLCAVHGLPPHRVAWVHPGINVDRLQSDGAPRRREVIAGQGGVVGIVAALRPEKDHETFLRAAALVANRLPDTRFLVVGDGARRPQLEELARTLGVDSRVQFLGWRNVDLDLLRRFDVLTLSSREETFPAAILEALAAGIPVVTTDVGSVRELFGDYRCGVIVPPGDPAALAEGISAVLCDRRTAQEASEAGLRRAGYFSGERFCQDMLVLARRISEAKRRGPVADVSQFSPGALVGLADG
jgi:glycosyltransferase involved in cell wall biosynthesis